MMGGAAMWDFAFGVSEVPPALRVRNLTSGGVPHKIFNWELQMECTQSMGRIQQLLQPHRTTSSAVDL